MTLADRAARITLLVLDVDGVLTDGGIVYSDAGEELKRFHVRDGSGLKLWRLAGNQAALVSGRSSPAVERRANELGIGPVIQGRSDKRPALDELLRQTGRTAEQACAIGDDLPDWPLLSACGLGIAVADACPELRTAADYVTGPAGGHGAVRDAIEWLLKLQGRWDGLVRQYQVSG